MSFNTNNLFKSIIFFKLFYFLKIKNKIILKYINNLKIINNKNKYNICFTFKLSNYKINNFFYKNFFFWLLLFFSNLWPVFYNNLKFYLNYFIINKNITLHSFYNGYFFNIYNF